MTPMDSTGTDSPMNQEGEPLGMGMTFSDDVFVPGKERRKLTRREKRESRSSTGREWRSRRQ